MLKALDFIDAWGPDMRLLNVCRARARQCRRRGAISCGLAFPGKLRWQGRKIGAGPGAQYVRDHSKWGFFCHVDWQMLVDEQSRFPDDPELKGLVEQIAGPKNIHHHHLHPPYPLQGEWKRRGGRRREGWREVVVVVYSLALE